MGTHRAYQRKAAGGHAHRLRRAAAVPGHRDGLLLRSRSNGKTRDTAFGCVPRFRPSKNAKKEKKRPGKKFEKGVVNPFFI